MQVFRRLMIFLILVPGLAATAWAQPQMGMAGGRNPGVMFSRIFGDNASFTATAELTMNGQHGSGMHSMEMDYAVRDGQVRIEMDLAKMKGGNMPAEAIARMKQMGMDRSITLVRAGPDKGTYMIYPSMKAYVEMPAGKGMAGDDQSGMPDIKKEKVGSESVDGHPCDKYRVTVTQPNGRQVELFTWQATDMNDFPIKSEMTNNQGEVTIHFTDINQAKPDASLFALPSGYKGYDSMQQMMMSNMGGMMGNMLRMHGGK